MVAGRCKSLIFRVVVNAQREKGVLLTIEAAGIGKFSTRFAFGYENFTLKHRNAVQIHNKGHYIHPSYRRLPELANSRPLHVYFPVNVNRVYACVMSGGDMLC